MNRLNSRKNRRQSARGIFFYIVSGLLILTLLSTYLVCGMFAKYVTRGSASGFGRVAKGLQIEIKEHKVELIDGVYELTKTETGGQIYDTVLPGVDIPKDPFVRLYGTCEVDYELRLRVTETNFPKVVDKDGNPVLDEDGNEQYFVKYEIDKQYWKLDDSKTRTYGDITEMTYIYTGYLDSGLIDRVIPILTQNTRKVTDDKGNEVEKECSLIVSEHYVGAGDFSLQFDALIVQID